METNYGGLINEEGEIWVAGSYVKVEYTSDELLDQYNNAIYLYEQFGDEEYLETSKRIMQQLKAKQYIEEK